MKYIILSILILFLISCSNKSNKKDILEQKNTLEPHIEVVKSNNSKKTDLSEYHTELDTVQFKTERGDIYKYEKTIYNQIIDKHPEFFKDYPYPPELSYRSNYDFENFSSEVGQDNYYVLYAHFLKKKNGDKKLKKERNKIIEIYTHINSIFQRLQYGGTYFGHQYSRILGFAEYSLYLKPKDNDKFGKTYDISKQKELYIASLRQLIKDESSIDFQTIGEENKLERLQGLNKKIDELEILISDIFYLRRSQEFQYSNYEYH
jgi:hypothetical protein